MSRRSSARSTISRSSNKQSTQNNLLARLPEQEQHLLAIDDDQMSNISGQVEHETMSSSSSRVVSSVRITSNSTTVNGVPASMSNGAGTFSGGQDLILTRSQCVPGRCSAGCPLHDNRRKRKPKNRDDASTNTDSVAGDFG